MVPLYTVVALLVVHFVGDFILQTEKMAVRKSSEVKWLTIHVLVYSALLLPFGPVYAVVNGMLHWSIDYVTSRLNAHYWAANDMRRFFRTVGADQLFHGICLMATIRMALPFWQGG